MMRKKIIQFGLIMVLISVTVCSIYAQKIDNCNYDGFKDTYLRKRISSAQEQLALMEGQLQGRETDNGGLPDFHTDVVTGKKINFSYEKNGVESINIDCDAPDHLNGTIYLNGITNGYLLIEITNAKYQKIQNIDALKIPIPNASKIPFVVELGNQTPQNSFFSSTYLKLSYFESNNVSKGKSFWFDLNKNWKKNISNSQRISKVILTNKQEFNQDKNTTINNNANKVKIPRITNLSSEISKPILSLFHLDINNIYYDSLNNSFTYVPKNFFLKHNTKSDEAKYGLLINYGNLREGEGMVSYTLNLSGGVEKKEIEIVKKILKKKYTLKNVSLKPVNIEDELIINLSLVGQLNIKKDQISIGKIRNFGDQLDVSFNCDLLTSDELLSQLASGVKITGSVSFGANNMQSIPLEVDLMDKKSFGLIYSDYNYLTDTNTIYTNEFPFPVEIKNLVLYDSETGATKTFDIINNELSPLSKMQIANTYLINQNSEPVPKYDLCWFNYDFKGCQECFDELVSSFSSATLEGRRKYIRFENFYSEVFEKYNAKALKILIKSNQIDPRNTIVKSLSYDLKPVQDVLEMGPLFTTDESNITYQYQIELITLDDTFTSSWIPAKSMELYLQRSSFELAFKNTSLLKK